jgi:acyl-CoA dehydrogenase
LKAFDRAIFGHIGFTLSNAVRAFWLGVTNAHLTRPPVHGPMRRYCQKLTRLSAAFAFISDMAMLTLGGTLKRRERISARFADVLSYMYLASAVIKRFEDDGRPADDLPLLRWSCDYCIHQAEKTLVVVLKNFPSRFLNWLLGGLVFPTGRRYQVPSDAMGHAAAKLLLEPSAARDRLTQGMFVSRDPADVTGRIEDALAKVIAAEPLEKKLQKLVDQHPTLHGDFPAQVEAALKLNVLNGAEAELVRAAYAARRAVITVDDFDHDWRVREPLGTRTDAARHR